MIKMFGYFSWCNKENKIRNKRKVKVWVREMLRLFSIQYTYSLGY